MVDSLEGIVALLLLPVCLSRVVTVFKIPSHSNGNPDETPKLLHFKIHENVMTEQCRTPQLGINDS